MSSSTVTEARRESMPWASILVAGIAAILLALVANLIVRWIALQIADIPGGFEPLASVGPVILASLYWGVMATIAYAITRRFARNPRRTWLIVGLIGLVVSFIPALSASSQDGATTAGVATLIVMHTVAAAITIPPMLRLAGE
jgi:hypothetical protein